MANLVLWYAEVRHSLKPYVQPIPSSGLSVRYVSSKITANGLKATSFVIH